MELTAAQLITLALREYTTSSVPPLQRLGLSWTAGLTPTVTLVNAFGFRSDVAIDQTLDAEENIPFQTVLGAETQSVYFDGTTLDDAVAAIGGFGAISQVICSTGMDSFDLSTLQPVEDIYETPLTYSSDVLSGPSALAVGDQLGLSTDDIFRIAQPDVIEGWLNAASSVTAAGTSTVASTWTFTVPRGYTAQAYAQWVPGAATNSTTTITSFERINYDVSAAAMTTDDRVHATTSQQKIVLPTRYEPGEYTIAVSNPTVNLTALRLKVKYIRD